MEEYGHFVDAPLNLVDTPGDEGELFSALVRGMSLSVTELNRIQAEDDHAAVVIDGASIEVEQATTLIGEWNPFSIARALAVVGHYVYAVGDGLSIIDISNPVLPTLTGNYDIPGYANDVYVMGGYAYVIDDDSGLLIIDIGNPALPTLKGSYNTSGYAYGVQVVGSYAYVADFTYGLNIIDISNPALPILKGNYNTSGYARDVRVVGNYAYVADDDSGLQVIDISNPVLLTLKGNYDTSGSAYDVQVAGSLAYVADDDSGLQIIDISNPALPTLKGSYNTSGSARDVQVVGSYAYVADDDSGLQIIDISNPTLPTLKGNYNTSGSADGVQVVGNYAYIADDDSGLQIVDISNPSFPTLKGNYNPSGQAYDLQVVGNYAYVADADSGLQIIDISIPALPILKGNYNTSGSADGVHVVGNYAYVADADSGLQIIDISNPTLPTLKGNYDTPGSADGVQIVGNYAYVADGSSGLQIIDISNPALPTLKGNYNTPGLASDVQVAGNYAYVADWMFPGLQIIDISNPALPTLKGEYGSSFFEDYPGQVNDLQVVGRYAYLAFGTSGLRIIDVSDPARPTYKGDYDSGYAQSVHVVGSYAYVADLDHGLTIIDISNPALPTLTGNYDTSGYTVGVQVVGSYAYIADSSGGLKIVDVSDLGRSSISLSVISASVPEDSANLVYTFTRTGETSSYLTVNYDITGTADSTDYTGATPGTGKIITFSTGSSTATLSIDPTDDTIVEPDETVTLTLATGIGYSIGTRSTVTGTILNDDQAALPTITLAVSPASVTEDRTTNLTYTFSRTGATTNALTINYGITGTADSSDYTGATPGPGKTISFALGSSTASLTIDPTTDTTTETDETVVLTLVAGTGYSIGTTAAVVSTILNDDFPVISLAVSPAFVAEDGTANLVYTFSRTGDNSSGLTVNYTVVGTATLGIDYTGIAVTPATKTVAFAAGSATAIVTVDPAVDTTIEPDETVALTLAAGTGYTIGTTAAVIGTITSAQYVPGPVTVAGVNLGRLQLGYALNNGSGTPISITSAGAIATDAGGWTALAAAATGNGYDLYWKNTNGMVAKWILNGSAELTSAFVISTADFLQAERSLGTDLDGDGNTGFSFSVAKTIGSVQFGSSQFGYALKNGSNPLLSITNVGAIATEAGGWRALAAAAVGNGYDLYWKNSNGMVAKWILNGSAELTSAFVISTADFFQAETNLAADLDADGKTGPFAIYRGSAANDIITGQGNVSFGLAGADTLTPGGSSSLGFDRFIGGAGADAYILPSGTTAIIADEGNSAGDSLTGLGFALNRTSTVASTLDGGRHLIIDDSSTGSRLYLLDWKEAKNQIETVTLADGAYTFLQMQQKINSLGTLPDYSWAQWDSLYGGSKLTMLGIASSRAMDGFSDYYRSISNAG